MRIRFVGSTHPPIFFEMVLAADHWTPATGLTPAVTLSKNGTSFAPAAGAVTESVTESGDRSYRLTGNATDRDTTGTLVVRATAPTADDVFVVVQIIDPYDQASTSPLTPDEVLVRAALVSAGQSLSLQKICEYTGLTEEEVLVAARELLRAGWINLVG